MDRNNILFAERLVNRKLNPIFYILVTLFWIDQIWAPFDDYVTQGNLNIFQIFFRSDIIYKVSFSMAIVFFISIFLLHKFQKYYRLTRFPFYFFIFTFITIILINLLNPNNHFELRHYLGNNVIKYFYLFLLFLFSMIFLKKEILIFIVKKFFYIGSIILFLRVVLSLFLFILNRGMIWQGRNVTISTSDTLFCISLFQIIYFAMFLDNKNYKNLFISSIFLITLFLSYRRAYLWVALITDFTIMFYFLYIIKGSRKKIKTSLIALIIIVSIGFSIYYIIGQKRTSDFFLRGFGAFSYFYPSDIYITQARYMDSGHFEQSIQTTISFFKNAEFWGSGLGDVDIYYVEGQSAAIHNSFVRVWADYGLNMTIFLLVLLLLFFSQIIKFIVQAIRREYFTDCTTFGVILFCIVFTLSGWLTGASFIYPLRFLFMFVLLLCFVVFNRKDLRDLKINFFQTKITNRNQTNTL